MRKLVTIIGILCCPIGMLSAQDGQDSSRGPLADARSVQRASTDTRDPRADLTKMRVLLEQMQRNVAFVSAGDTPMKHQFELEIEMWQLLLRDLEKKLNSSEAAPAK